MNLFKVFTGSYGESNGASSDNQGADATIVTLCSRLKSATLLADRRDAVRGLKSLAKSYRKEVGDHCLLPLLDCLCKDRNDHELMNLCLDALCSIFCETDDGGPPSLRPDGTSVQASEAPSEEVLTSYAEKLTKDEVFTVILACLEENDFSIRFPAIRLLIALLQLRNREFQQLVLLNPTAVARFMDLLSDVREVVRNDVLVLLIHLTRGNSSIQKIVVFENVFEKLFSIMASEGYADGGVVTEDCLELLLSLLAGNGANQLLFREGSFIQHLVPFFDSLPSSPLSVQKTWSSEKAFNFILLFQLIRHLVTPGSGQQQIAMVQKTALHCGLLKKTAELLSEAGLPSPVLIEALGAVGELTRDLPAAQDSVLHLNVASMRPPRPLVVVLLMSLINDKQPTHLRLAILYAVQCLLYRNKQAQMKIIQGMCPENIVDAAAQQTSNQADSQLAFSTSAGQLIISGLLALDSPSTWLTASVLVAALGTGVESCDLRESLLKAQLALSLGAQPVTLLQQITTTLAMQKLRLSTRAGLLQLLCVWLAFCPSVVDALLADAPAVACLLSQISQPPCDADEAVIRSLSAFAVGLCILFNRQTDQRLEYNRDKLINIVRRRIGIETFGDALSVIATNEEYARSLRSPRPSPLVLSATGREETNASEVPLTNLPLFTHEFCVTYRQLEHDVLGSLAANQQQQQQQFPPNLADQRRASPAIFNQYDPNGYHHQQQLQQATNDRLATLESNLADRTAECEQLRRELTSYKMALADGSNEYRAVLAEKDRAIGQLQAELMAARSYVQPRGSEKNSSECVGHVAEIERLKSDLSSLRQEQEDLLLLLSHQDTRIARLREKLQSLGQQDSENEESDDEEGGDKKEQGKLPEVGLGESASGLSSPPQQQPQQQYFQPVQVPNQSMPPPPPPPGAYPTQFDPTQQQQQQQSYPNYSYPYPYHQQQQYPYQQYNLPPPPPPQAPQQQQQPSIESYFTSTVVIGEQDVQGSQDRDGSESGATSDSQNSQIRIIQ